MSGLLVNVRQIGNYPLAHETGESDLVLVQQGGLGGPYASVTAADLVATALANSSMGLGNGVPPDAAPGQLFADALSLLIAGDVLWNAYGDAAGTAHYRRAGTAAQFGWSEAGFGLWVMPAGATADSGWPGSSFAPLLRPVGFFKKCAQLGLRLGFELFEVVALGHHDDEAGLDAHRFEIAPIQRVRGHNGKFTDHLRDPGSGPGRH